MPDTLKVIKLIISETLKIEYDIINENKIINDFINDNKLLQYELINNLLTEFDINSNIDKQLISIKDALGRTVKEVKNMPLFYIYSDGSVEKRIIVE